MRHARSDYDRIQDPSNLIPEDEPVFLIRAQDKIAPMVLKHYADLAAAHACDRVLVQRVMRHASAMEKWQEERGSKLPDMPDDVDGD